LTLGTAVGKLRAAVSVPSCPAGCVVNSRWPRANGNIILTALQRKDHPHKHSACPCSDASPRAARCQPRLAATNPSRLFRAAMAGLVFERRGHKRFCRVPNAIRRIDAAILCDTPRKNASAAHHRQIAANENGPGCALSSSVFIPRAAAPTCFPVPPLRSATHQAGIQRLCCVMIFCLAGGVCESLFPGVSPSGSNRCRNFSVAARRLMLETKTPKPRLLVSNPSVYSETARRNSDRLDCGNPRRIQTRFALVLSIFNGPLLLLAAPEPRLNYAVLARNLGFSRRRSVCAAR